MTPERFAAMGKKIYGDAWMDSLAAALGLSRVTIWRYATGRTKISAPVKVAMRELARKK